LLRLTVYIGGAASISFLQIVRDLVSQQIGPSAFSHNEKSDRMLEVETPQANAPEPEVNVMDLDGEQKLRYLRSYYAVVSASTSLSTAGLANQSRLRP
jgi:hypothetical protein